MSPLAEKLRPKSFDEYVGQEHLVAHNGSLQKLIKEEGPLLLYFGGRQAAAKLR